MAVSTQINGYLVADVGLKYSKPNTGNHYRNQHFGQQFMKWMKVRGHNYITFVKVNSLLSGLVSNQMVS